MVCHGRDNFLGQVEHQKLLRLDGSVFPKHGCCCGALQQRSSTADGFFHSSQYGPFCMKAMLDIYRILIWNEVDIYHHIPNRSKQRDAPVFYRQDTASCNPLESITESNSENFNSDYCRLFSNESTDFPSLFALTLLTYGASCSQFRKAFLLE